MIHERLKHLLVDWSHGDPPIIIAVTGDGQHRVTGDGYFENNNKNHPIKDELPDVFRHKFVADVRCDGESTVIKLEDGFYISLGWSIDTRSGQGYYEILFHTPDEIDEDFMEFYDGLTSTRG